MDSEVDLVVVVVVVVVVSMTEIVAVGNSVALTS